MGKRMGILLLVLMVLIVTGVGRALAQDGSSNAPQAVLGTGFTYQGVLKNGSGTPITNTCDFVFNLWDALTAGTQVGANSAVTGVSVTSGAFNAVVNSGNQFGNAAFTGQARWLQILVKCVGDATYTSLTPRQAVTPAPYALTLRSGAAIQGDGGGSGMGLYVQNTTASGTAYGLVGESTSTAGRGVYGNASAISGSTSGVYGSSSSSSGYGVAGLASAASGSTSGVYGTSASTSGRGVTGYANALTGSTSGVRGLADSTAGTGVYGGATAASGATYGVRGVSASPTGIGIYGSASAASGVSYGVKGDSNSTTGIGVYGIATAASGNTAAVRGDNASTSGSGVFGLANSPGGITNGVFGQTHSSNGRGVYGYSTATTGPTSGVRGETVSTDGFGVFGIATDTTGAGFAYGVYGQTDSHDYVAGVYGYASTLTTVTYGVQGISNSNGGAGVYGNVPSASGTTFGVLGQSSSTGGFGMFGEAGALSGTTYGVYGRSWSTSGSGVSGYNPAGTGITYGVTGQSDSTAGTGVYGYAKAATGVAFGVTGKTDSTDGGAGVYGISGSMAGVLGQSNRYDLSSNGYGVAGYGWNSTAVGVGAWSFNSDLFRGYSGDFPTGTLRFYVDNTGTVYAHGGFVIYAPSSLDGAEHATSSIQSSENWMEDFGFASLEKGKAVVEIAADFAGMVDLSIPYHVYITPRGDCALYVAETNARSFSVSAVGGSACNIVFDYRIVARPAGTTSQRLPTLATPVDTQAPRQPADGSQSAPFTQPADNNLPGEKPQK